MWYYEIRGGYEEYKPPEIKETNFLKQTYIGKIREIQSGIERKHQGSKGESIKRLPSVNKKESLVKK